MQRPWGSALSAPVRRRLLRRTRLVLERLDWVLLAAVGALTAIGAVLVWSATRPGLLAAGVDSTTYLKKHLLSVLVGSVFAVAAGTLDYRLTRAYAPILYAAACLGLVGVLTPLGSTIKGHHSWIQLGAGFQLQPSEFAKVGLVLLLAMLLGEHREAATDSAEPAVLDVVLALTAAVVPVGLVLLQPDLGTTIVLLTVVYAMVAVAGVAKRWLFALAGGALAAIGMVWRLGLLKQYQLNRFIAFAHPAADPRGAGYNARQARIAVGSGGFTGRGLFRGTQTSGHFVPEQHTDFVFTVAGEELGFVGSALIITLLGVVLWRGFRIAACCQNTYGTLLATGIVCWFGFQTFENIGMTVGITPITGVPLPFISYGGSATIADLIALGLLQAIHTRSKIFT